MDTTIPTWIAQAGALGTTAMALVEAAKKTNPWFGTLGTARLVDALGPGATAALRAAYGPGFDAQLHHLYRQSDDELAAALENGIKVGLAVSPPEVRVLIATEFGQDPAKLTTALAVDPATQATGDVADARYALGQFELAVHVRVQAAVTSSSAAYAGWLQVWAGVVAMGLAAVAWATLDDLDLWKALLLGLVAVPIAPIAKDLTSALRTASDALRARA